MNLKNIVIILIIFMMAILQVTLMPKINISGNVPNLILLVSIILIFMREEKLALLAAGLGGFFLDFYSPFRFGFYTLFILFLTIMLYLLMERVFTQINRFVLIISIFSIVLIFDFVNYYLAEHRFSTLIFIDGIYSLIFAILIYFILRKIIKEPENILI